MTSNLYSHEGSVCSRREQRTWLPGHSHPFLLSSSKQPSGVSVTEEGSQDEGHEPLVRVTEQMGQKSWTPGAHVQLLLYSQVPNLEYFSHLLSCVILKKPGEVSKQEFPNLTDKKN